MVQPKRLRAQMNRSAWLASASSFACALTVLSIVALLFGGDVEFLTEVILLDVVSSVFFGLCSGAMLIRHRTIAIRWAVSAGALLGVSTYLCTSALWLLTAPSFRHAVPFDLLPPLLSVVFGLVTGGAFYLSSLTPAA